MRTPTSAPPSIAPRDALDLALLRESIEHIDDALLVLLSERQQMARQVGAAKRALGVAIADPAREAAVMRRVAERARELALDADAMRELFRRIIALSREEQRSE